ncbi:MAG: hypothetical protein RXR43_04555 [Sulfolobus sp.]
MDPLTNVVETYLSGGWFPQSAAAGI